MGIRPPGHEAVQGERVKPWPAKVGTIREETGGLAPEMQCIYNAHVPANRSRPSCAPAGSRTLGLALGLPGPVSGEATWLGETEQWIKGLTNVLRCGF